MRPFLPLPLLLEQIPAFAAPASTRLLVSYRPIGFGDRNRILVHHTGDATTIVVQDIPIGQLVIEATRLVSQHSELDNNLFAAVYIGHSGFLPMAGLLANLTTLRPRSTLVGITCGCLSEDKHALLKTAVATGVLKAVAWCGCGATREMHALRLALDGITPTDAIRLTPGFSPTDGGFSLDA